MAQKPTPADTQLEIVFCFQSQQNLIYLYESPDCKEILMTVREAHNASDSGSHYTFKLEFVVTFTLL